MVDSHIQSIITSKILSKIKKLAKIKGSSLKKVLFHYREIIGHLRLCMRWMKEIGEFFDKIIIYSIKEGWLLIRLDLGVNPIFLILYSMQFKIWDIKHRVAYKCKQFQLVYRRRIWSALLRPDPVNQPHF